MPVTALPPGIVVTLKDPDDVVRSWPALALLHQVRDDDVEYWENSERVVLGVLNPHRCEIEPVDTDLELEHEWADKLVGVHFERWMAELDARELATKAAGSDHPIGLRDPMTDLEVVLFTSR